jgi:hypothetical protein
VKPFLGDWEDPCWTHDMAARRASFADKIGFLLDYTAGGIPCAVPLHVTAALRPGELAMQNLDSGQWFGLPANGRERLISDGETHG